MLGVLAQDGITGFDCRFRSGKSESKGTDVAAIFATWIKHHVCRPGDTEHIPLGTDYWLAKGWRFLGVLGRIKGLCWKIVGGHKNGGLTALWV
jgi:hypothetical protein